MTRAPVVGARMPFQSGARAFLSLPIQNQKDPTSL